VTIRKAIFWFHLVLGCLAGIIVLVMSATGIALTYQKQITSWADKRMFKIEPVDGRIALSPELLLKNLQKVRPEARPTSINISSDPGMPASMALGPAEMIFVNPHTGEILGTGAQGIRTFFRVMTDWHRWLGFSGGNRGIGRAVTGAGNLIFLFLAITGLYLWWPQKWTRGILRAITWFRLGSTGKARDSNWHYVFGFWCIVPLIAIIASGVVISYSWASNLVFRIAGEEPPKLGLRRPGMNPATARNNPPLQLQDLDQLFQNVQTHSAGWKTISIQPPTVADKTAVFTVDRRSGVQPQLRSTLTIEKASGKIIRSEGFNDMGPGMRARMWMRFVHTGEYYGFWGQTIAAIASIGGMILVWTGIALTFRRYMAAVRLRAEA
jgi:uncharacterized iron-regulated membrane protein